MSSDIYPALGRVTSGIYILSIGQGERATGMLASWVMQAGFEPPMITVAVRHGRYVAEWLAAGEPFVLNIVSESQKHWLKHFGKGFEPGEPSFTGLELHLGANGVAVLSDALGYLECEPTSHLDSGEHRIFLAKVTAGKMQHDASPMVHIRKTGVHY
jgi:flavin reductase (DIM6/NTAB) family NADH-FMN oxidoreductase RutF